MKSKVAIKQSGLYFQDLCSLLRESVCFWLQLCIDIVNAILRNYTNARDKSVYYVGNRDSAVPVCIIYL